ncbi:hypothetical protein FEM48_Zijuj01G0219500 [Ziziphus jujuba var. spinosa]|uniref:Uncharacterized protein n=1 Tax=Ziziphus jujuba var. spinosa TaxID=714518 RepID=A0A978W3S7_ZIZJJ|nr:hypothetical protein FEM48_Zijuj01G0219500 [Ziziphus jujuba var. spinosa]
MMPTASCWQPSLLQLVDDREVEEEKVERLKGFLSTFPLEKLDHCHHPEVEERYTIIVIDCSSPTSRSHHRLRRTTVVFVTPPSSNQDESSREEIER